MTTTSPTHVRGGPLGWARSLAPFLGCVALAVIMQVLVRPQVGDFYAKLILDIATNVVLAVSLTMVNGFTGQFSLGHAAFMLVGAYVGAMLVYYGSFRLWDEASVRGGLLSSMSSRDGVPWLTVADGLFLLSLLAGGLAAAGCGYLVGLPSLRLKGDYLAIVTLGFGEIVRVLIQSQARDVLYDPGEIKAAPVVGLAQLFHEPGKNWYAWWDHGVEATDWSAPLWIRTGGALGFTGLPSYTSLFWVFLAAGGTLVVAFRLKRSTFGRAMLSIREDEIAAEAMGVDVTRYKIRAFVVSAFFAGLAGGLFAHTSGVQLNPGELGFQKSFDIIIMVVLGGLGSISGAMLAAGMLTLLPEWLRDPGHVWPYGLVVLVLAVAFSARRVRAGLVVAGVTGALELARHLALRNGVELADYRMILYALLLIAMMILRPQGLLGVRELWDASLWAGLWRGLWSGGRRRG